jgi:hypothetical protein
MNNCVTFWLGIVKMRAKRLLNQNRRYTNAKVYPHSILTIVLQLNTAYENEMAKFARMWCVEDVATVITEMKAVRELFEAEDGDGAVLYTELLASTYDDNIDRLISGIRARLRA